MLVVMTALPLLAQADGDVAARLKAKMAKLFPGEEVTDVRPSPLRGVYEVLLGASLIYMSEDGRYVLRGDLIDIDHRTNVSSEVRSAIRKKLFASLNSDQYIEFAPVSGKPKATLYVYTDIDCPYCRKMHSEISKITGAGISVRYLAFPRSGLKGESFRKATAVWCAANRQEALTEAKLGESIPAGKCASPVAEEYKLGQSMGVSGTPAVYTSDGENIGGYIPASELIEMMKEGKI